MGSVLKAHDPNLDRIVAIKTMRTGNMKKKADFDEFKERFFLEAKANGRLNHPNIVSVYDSGLQDDEPYLVMEYVEGQSLEAYVEKRYEERLNFLSELMHQIASGLDYAHEEGVIHRDVKPGNIIVISKRKKPRAKILDFGLAKLKDSKLTATGYFLGTPSYSSPEQVKGAKLDIHSDLFSFGVLTYEMLTGFLPFDGETLHSILYKIAHEPPVLNFDAFTDYLDVHALMQVFRTILHKDPDARFDSAGTFIDELTDLLKPLKDKEIPKKLLAKRDKKKTTKRRKNKAKAKGSEDKTVLSQSLPENPDFRQTVREARNQFRMAYETGNISSVRYCLKELEEMGVVVNAEKAMLATLEEKVRREAELAHEKNRSAMISAARDEFEISYRARNPASARYSINELKKLSADVSQEEEKLGLLEQELSEEEAERRSTQRKRKEIEDLRWSFQKRVEREDLEGSKRLLERLRDLDAGVKAEETIIAEMEKEAQRAREQREGYVQRTRAQFQEALQTEDLQRCRRLVKELEGLLRVDAADEKKSLAALEESLLKRKIKQQQQSKIEGLRKDFDDALQDNNIDGCKKALKELKSLRAEVARETKALTTLRKRIRGDQDAKLRHKLIEGVRRHFRDELTRKNLEGCRYYLRELRQIVDDVNPEEKALSLLENMLREQEADKVKDQMVAKLRDQFRTASMHRNLENCAYYLRELEQLGADCEDERATLAQIEHYIAAELELQNKMIMQSRERFNDALAAGDATECEHYLNVLHELGAYTNEEQEALANLKQNGREDMSKNEKKAMITRFRNRFDDAFEEGNKDSMKFYLGELNFLNADTSGETKKLKSFH